MNSENIDIQKTTSKSPMTTTIVEVSEIKHVANELDNQKIQDLMKSNETISLKQSIPNNSNQNFEFKIPAPSTKSVVKPFVTHNDLFDKHSNSNRDFGFNFNFETSDNDDENQSKLISNMKNQINNNNNNFDLGFEDMSNTAEEKKGDFNNEMTSFNFNFGIEEDESFQFNF